MEWDCEIRVLEVWREVTSPQLKQGQLDRLLSAPSRQKLNISKEGESEQLVLGVTILIVDKFFMSKLHYLYAHCPLSGHHWEESAFVFFTFSCQIWIHVDKILPDPSLLKAEQSQLSQPLLCQTLPSFMALAGLTPVFPCLSRVVEPSLGELGHRHCPLDTTHTVHQNRIRGGRIQTCVSQLFSLTARLCFLARLRWFPSLASLPCCSESLVGMIIRSGEVDESLSCRAVQFCVEHCADLPTHLGWRFIYGALWSDTVISLPSPHSRWCLLTTRFLPFFSSPQCVK